jgi:hypothetical protein
MVELNNICMKDILTPDNYNIWISEMELLLQIKDIDNHVLEIN